MSAANKLIDDVIKLDAREAAERLVASQHRRGRWLDVFTEHLDRRRAGQSLTRTLAVWDLNQSQAARLFGVSRQALNKWMEQGVPGERAEAVADLAAATDLLVHHLKRDRIPAVVRRAIPALGDQSLLDLLSTGETAGVLQACRDMFAFERAHT